MITEANFTYKIKEIRFTLTINQIAIAEKLHRVGAKPFKYIHKL